ncbi:MAG: amino acid racemase [archaeon]
MKNKYKTIGILGGMGPEATAELYSRIIKIFQKKYGAVYDNDFPEIIILNLPLPDIVKKVNNNVEKTLIYGAKKLESSGVDFIAIPCNTVTPYIKILKENVSVPIINIVEETAKEVKNSNLKKIGLLATETTINDKIYSAYLPKLITLDEKNQKITTKLIMNILSGDKSGKKMILKLIKKLKEKGAEKVILGCTELPLIYNGEDIFDTIDILARIIVRNSKII